jgi:uncharacterized membrane protein
LGPRALRWWEEEAYVKKIVWSFLTIEDTCQKKLTWRSDGKKLKNQKNLRGNERTMHGFNNCKVMANLDFAIPFAIFSSRIVELLGHYILDDVVIGLELFCFCHVKTCNL